MLQRQSLWPSLRKVAKLAEENMISFVTIDDGCDQLGRPNGQKPENAVERGWRLDGEVQWAKGYTSIPQPPFCRILDDWQQ